MGMVEVAYQFRDQAQYLIASEENEPSDGWQYDTFLWELSGDPSMSAARICSLVVETYADRWDDDLDFRQTLSAVDLSLIRPVATAIEELAGAIISGSSWGDILAMPSPEQFGDNSPFYDLYDFADLITVYVTDPIITAKATAVKSTIANAVITNYWESDHQYAHGLSIFLPKEIPPDYHLYIGGHVDFADSTNWPMFLEYYFNSGIYAADFWEPNDAMTQAGFPLDPNFVYSSIVSSLQDVDWWLINSGMNETIKIILNSPANADLDLHLYGMDKVSFIGSSENRGTGVPDTIQYNSTGQEFFYLSVSGYNSYSTSPYYLFCDQIGNQYGWFQLSFDDDSPETGSYTSGAYDVLGTTFPLPSYPMKLDRVWINFTNLSGGGGGDGTFYLLLYDNYGYVVDPFTIGPLIPPGTGWTYLDLSSFNVSVFSEIFIGVWYNGVSTPVIRADTRNSGRDYYFNANTYTWQPINGSLFFRIDVRYPSATGILEPNQNESTPSEFALLQNYPNPFNASTIISFETRSAGIVTLDIYNILGQRVFVREIEIRQPGPQTFTWEGLNNAGKSVPSGIYFYRVQSDGASESRKMVLLK